MSERFSSTALAGAKPSANELARYDEVRKRKTIAKGESQPAPSHTSLGIALRARNRRKF